MPVSSADLWKLLKQSRLLPPERLEQVRIALEQAGSRTGRQSATSLAQWLLRQQMLTQYQAKVLLSGRAGPFVYGDYQIQDRVRGGRLGGAFQAVHLPTSYPVLVKFVDSRIAQDPRRWHVARQHVHAARPIHQPQLQRVFALEDLSGYRFLVLERLEGTSLDLRLKVVERLPTSEACRIARLVAAGLAELHAHRQVYGDIRPWNIWIEPGDHVKLLRDSVQPPLVPEWSQPGLTPAQLARADYLAPELAHPGTPLGPATDTYALGCTLYQLLHGRAPCAGGDPDDKLPRRTTEPPHALPPQEIPQELTNLIAVLLARDPAERMSEAAMIVDQLAPYVDATKRTIPTNPTTAAGVAFEDALRQTRSIPPAPPPLLTEPDEHPPIAEPPVQPAAVAGMTQEWAAEDTELEAATQEPPPPLAIGVVPTSPRHQSAHRLRRVRQARRKQAITLCACAAVLLIAVTSIGLLNPRVRETLLGRRATTGPAGQSPSEGAATAKGTTQPPVSISTPPDGSQRYDVRSDDGQLLWMTPTSGPPLELHFVPPGAQLILVARPHDLTASSWGTQVWQALGPEIATAKQSWEMAAGFPLEQVAQLVLALHDAEPLPLVFLQVELQQPHSEESLLAAWGNPPPTDYQDHHYYQSRGWTFFITDTKGGTQFVMGSESQIREVIDQKGAPTILRRELSRLLQSSDGHRHGSLLFVPEFLTKRLLSARQEDSPEEGQRLRQATTWLLGDDIKACLISWHFAEPFYLELRAAGQANQDSLAIAQSLRDRMGQVPDRMEQFFGQIYPSVYWRRVALRLPSMIRFLHRYARIGVEDDQAIVNAALPGQAAHNLVFSTEMLLHARTDASKEVALPPERPSVPQTIEELIEQPISLRFDQQSLEFAIRDLASEIRETYPSLPFPFDIQIMGNDLQLNGITRNQQVSNFQAVDKTLGEILTALVLRANPVTTVTKPSEVDQKLVWVVGPDSTDPKKQVLMITTRDAAERQGYKLPRSFLPE